MYIFIFSLYFDMYSSRMPNDEKGKKGEKGEKGEKIFRKLQ